MAWRRIAAVGTGAGLEPEPLALLAESIFAYIDEFSADSVEGYAEAQAAVEDLRRRRRQELATLLLREGPAVADLEAVAKSAGWRLPGSLAADPQLTSLLVARRLAPLEELTPRARRGCARPPSPTSATTATRWRWRPS